MPQGLAYGWQWDGGVGGKGIMSKSGKEVNDALGEDVELVWADEFGLSINKWMKGKMLMKGNTG